MQAIATEGLAWHCQPFPAVGTSDLPSSTGRVGML